MAGGWLLLLDTVLRLQHMLDRSRYRRIWQSIPPPWETFFARLSQGEEFSGYSSSRILVGAERVGHFDTFWDPTVECKVQGVSRKIVGTLCSIPAHKIKISNFYSLDIIAIIPTDLPR